MRWTKLKQNVESRFVPELRDRVAIQITRYRKAHDDEGELWLTLDGEKIYGSSYYGLLKQRSLRVATQGEEQPSAPGEIDHQLTAEGIADLYHLTKALFLSLGQSIDEMFESQHPLIRAIAMLDTRCGKRRLARMDLAKEHGLVLAAYAVRSGVETIVAL